jgi:hypothetical protein
MRKLPAMLMVFAFASVSLNAFAGAHGGAMDEKKMDPAKADEKMKAECAKLMAPKK